MPLATTTRTRPARVRRPLDEWRQRLAEDYLPLARALARPLKVRWPAAEDDFESAAWTALVEAAESFDPTRHVLFSIFARCRIKGALLDVQRHQLPWGYRDHADEAPLLERFSSETEMHGRVLFAEPDDPVGWEMEAVEEFEHWLGSLPPKYAAALREIYLHGKTRRRAAEILGCVESNVQRMHDTAMGLLRESWDARVRREGA